MISSDGLAGEADEGSLWTWVLPHGVTLPFWRAGVYGDEREQQQIPRGNDRKKGKDNGLEGGTAHIRTIGVWMTVSVA